MLVSFSQLFLLIELPAIMTAQICNAFKGYFANITGCITELSGSLEAVIFYSSIQIKKSTTKTLNFYVDL
jgi:hypothetical protein